MTRTKTESPQATFARRLRELREAAGLTLYAAAKRAGMGQIGWTRIEDGRVVPTWPTVCRLADALGVSVQRFRD